MITLSFDWMRGSCFGSIFFNFSSPGQPPIISLILPSLQFVLILSLVVSFDLNHAFESISRLLRAHQPPCILHEEEEEGTGIASDVVKVEGEDPATPGPLP